MLSCIRQDLLINAELFFEYTELQQLLICRIQQRSTFAILSFFVQDVVVGEMRISLYIFEFVSRHCVCNNLNANILIPRPIQFLLWKTVVTGK